MCRKRNSYVEPAPEYDADAYCVRGWKGVAWTVVGWQTEPDEDTEWSGYKNRTGKLACIMVGDDRVHFYEPEELSPLNEDEYCRECGQIGCGHN